MFPAPDPELGRPTWVLQCGLVPDVTKLVCLTDLKGGSADQTLSVVARKSVGGGTDLTDSNFTS